MGMANPLQFNFQIECSSMADMAQEIVKLNGFSDGETDVTTKSSTL